MTNAIDKTQKKWWCCRCRCWLTEEDQRQSRSLASKRVVCRLAATVVLSQFRSVWLVFNRLALSRPCKCRRCASIDVLSHEWTLPKRHSIYDFVSQLQTRCFLRVCVCVCLYGKWRSCCLSVLVSWMKNGEPYDETRRLKLLSKAMWMPLLSAGIWSLALVDRIRLHEPLCFLIYLLLVAALNSSTILFL